MADDSQRAKARATFGSSFFENSKAIPAPKNFASAQQKTANSRPIPTFKVGGAVKKADSGMPRNRPMPYDKMGAKLPRKADGGLPDVRKAAVMQRAMNDQAGSPITGMGAPPLKVMKKGGKSMKKSGKVAVSSVDFAPGMPREDIVTQRHLTVSVGPGQTKRQAMSAGSKIIGDTLYPSGSYKLTPEDMKDLNKDTGIDPYQKERIARIKSGKSTSPDAYKKGGKAMKMADGGLSERGKAFRAAYDRGDKEFTFNGKRFTTEMAKPSVPKASVISKATPSVSITRINVTTAPTKRQQDMSSAELAKLGAERRKGIGGKSVSDSPLFDSRPMKKADATGQTSAQMYKAMMNESKSMPKAKGNDDLYKLFVDSRGRDFNNKKQQIRMAARESAGRDLVRDVNKMGSSSDVGTMKKGGKIQTSADTARKLTKEMGGMNHGGMAMMKPQQKNLGGLLKKLAPIAGMGLLGAALGGKGKKLAKYGMLGMAGSMLAKKKNQPMSNYTPAESQEEITSIKHGGSVMKKALGGSLMSRPVTNVSMKTPVKRPSMPARAPMAAAPPPRRPAPMPPQMMKQMPPMPPREPRPQTSPPFMDYDRPPTSPMAPNVAMRKGGKAGHYAVGGAGKTRLGMAPIKRVRGGVAKSPLDHKTGDRRDPEYGDYILADKNAMKKLQNKPPAPVKKAQGGAAKVRRGMMTQSGQITPGVKPHKGIGGF